MTPARRRFPWLVYLIVLVAILAMTLAPIASVALAGVLAKSHGCQLDEGSAHPCIIAGADRGQLLYTLGVLGWLMLVTLPAGALAGLAWLIVLLVHYTARARAVRGSEN